MKLEKQTPVVEPSSEWSPVDTSNDTPASSNSIRSEDSSMPLAIILRMPDMLNMWGGFSHVVRGSAPAATAAAAAAVLRRLLCQPLRMAGDAIGDAIGDGYDTRRSTSCRAASSIAARIGLPSWGGCSSGGCLA